MLSATVYRAGTPLQQQRRSPSTSGATARRAAVQTQALFSFFSPNKTVKGGPSKAQALVDQLLELTERTEGGINASSSRRQEIEELVGELEAFCPRNPLRSPLLFGDYEVLYASKPQTAGGPFRSAPGRLIFRGQRALQSLTAPNLCVNEVTYKALGLLPGSARQEGEFTPISSNTFQLTFPGVDGKRKGGPPQRVIQIAYLDDRVRVARFVPPEDEEGAEPSFFVFRRLVDEEEQEEADEDAPAAAKRAPFSFGGGTRKIKAQAAAEEEEEEAPRGRRGGMLGTQLFGSKEGLATMAERRYEKQQGTGSTRGRGSGTGTTRRGGGAPGGTGVVGTARKTRVEVAAERAAAREAAVEAKAAAEQEKRAAREAAAEAKAAAEEERRSRLARQAEIKEAARDQLAELQSAAAEAADEAKQAVIAAKASEKEASDLLRQASQARSIISEAVGAATTALQELEELKQAEREAAGEANEARAAIKQLQGAAAKRRR